MKKSAAEQHRLTFLVWLATVATSLAFLPALSQQRYALVGALVAAAVAVTGTLLRLVRIPAVVVLTAQLVVIVELLFFGYGRHLRFGFVPTKASFETLSRQLEKGMQVAQEYAAPAPASVGLLLMVVFFIAAMAAVADFLAVGLRRVPLAGLPLLALYTVPVAAVVDGVPFYGFLPGAVGYLVLLMADERDRLTHWGKQVTRTAAPEGARASMDTSGLTAAGRRISFLALSAAVALPIVVPGFSSTLLGHPASKGPGDGGVAELTFNDPMISLANSLRRPNPVDLLTVTGDTQPQYLRLTVLDLPGPDAWTARPVDLGSTVPLASTLPLPTGMARDVPTQPHEMSISLEDAFPDDSAWLPVPFLLRSVDVSDSWSYVAADQTVVAQSTAAAVGLPRYNVAYSKMSLPESRLEAAGEPPADIVEQYGQVPGGIPGVVIGTAQAVTVEGTNDYERAKLLQSFFRDRGEFNYDVNVGYGYGYEAMAAFLDERRGFCQQFAATMAMMARIIGIPSRVVVGFLEPERSSADGYVFTSDNLHSWPELYFEGVGWVRFEPTQGVGAPFPQWAERTTPPSPSLATQDPLQGPDRDPELQPSPEPAPADNAAGGGGSGGGVPLSPGWLVSLGALAFLFLPAALRTAVRRGRMTRPIDDADAAESAWLELRDFIRDLRLPWSGSMTPRARERSVAPLLSGDDEALGALKRLAISVERARYARSLPPGVSPASDAKTVMASLSRSARKGERVRALLWPASLLAELRATWRRLRPSPRRRLRGELRGEPAAP